MGSEHSNPSQSAEAHSRGTFEFAFPHSTGDPWWLTDGYGYSKRVSPIVWLYRLGRERRSRRFNEGLR